VLFHKCLFMGDSFLQLVDYCIERFTKAGYRGHGCPFSSYMAEKEQTYFLEQFYSFSGGFLRKLWIHLMSFASIIQRRRRG
jgi:hypothetical protein